MTLRLQWTARSEVGLVREGNEDSGYAGSRLLVVADGMGGMVAGDLASKLTVQALRSLDDAVADDVVRALRAAVLGANDRLRVAVEAEPGLEGMGTTVTALLWDGHLLGLAHIGDSRGYLLRAGRLERITHDHTFVQSLVDEGRLSEAEARVHPHRSLLLRALDGRNEVEPDTTRLEVADGDRFLLCSDGLCGYVEDPAIAAALALGDRDDAVDSLIDLALRAGGLDNVTCLVADIVEPGSDRDLAGSHALAGTAPAAAGTGEGSTGGNPPAGAAVLAGGAILIGAAALDTVLPPELAEALARTPAGSAGVGAAGGGSRGTPAAPSRAGTVRPAAGRAGRGSRAGRGTRGGRTVDREHGGGAGSPQPGAAGSDTSDVGAADGDVAGADRGEAADPEELRYAPLHPRRFRWVSRALVTVVVLAVVAGSGWWAWGWSQRQYYVGAHGTAVVIYRGLPENVLGISLSSMYSADTGLTLASLPAFYQQRVESSVSGGSLTDAEDVVAMLRGIAAHCRPGTVDQSCLGDGPLQTTPPPVPSPTPTTSATAPASRPTGSSRPSTPARARASATTRPKASAPRTRTTTTAAGR